VDHDRELRGVTGLRIRFLLPYLSWGGLPGDYDCRRIVRTLLSGRASGGRESRRHHPAGAAGSAVLAAARLFFCDGFNRAPDRVEAGEQLVAGRFPSRGLKTRN